MTTLLPRYLILAYLLSLKYPKSQKMNMLAILYEWSFHISYLSLGCVFSCYWRRLSQFESNTWPIPPKQYNFKTTSKSLQSYFQIFFNLSTLELFWRDLAGSKIQKSDEFPNQMPAKETVPAKFIPDRICPCGCDETSAIRETEFHFWEMTCFLVRSQKRKVAHSCTFRACKCEEACWAHSLWINPTRSFTFADGNSLQQFINKQISGCGLKPVLL